MSDPDGKDAPDGQQQSTGVTEDPSSIPHGEDIDALSSQADMLEVAREFLKDEAIKSEPRARKVEFLQQKGLKSEEIEKLLGTDDAPQQSSENSEKDLKTVHDSTSHVIIKENTSAPIAPRSENSPQPPSQSPPRDAPPIITYPEFLLKPQKPPPLVTFQRLLNAGYALAGLSTLTYGASKYLVEPMVQNLTEARHDLASTTLEDLKKFNAKLETSVSHVPYTASAAALKAQRGHDEDDETMSIDSDPTELFHRDIATQTSPQLSASTLNKPSSSSSKSLDTINTQTTRLESLHTTLESLVSSLNPSSEPFMPTPATKKLHDTIGAFQSLLDRLESTYNPFRTDFTSSSSHPVLSASSSQRSKGDNNESAKFKAEIRALKGAFLSSRNFPAARPQSFTNYGSSSGH